MQQKLPDYMLPSVFVLLEALPLTPNGKVDRNALLEPNLLQPEPETVYVAPQTEAEKTLATIVEKVLQVEKVGVHDDFFAIGASSVDIVRIHRRLLEALQRDVGITEIFRHRTISSLLAHLGGGQDEGTGLQKSYDRARARRASTRRRRREFRAARGGKGESESTVPR
jgi:hypothetical protein